MNIDQDAGTAAKEELTLQGTIAVRQWALEKALLCRADLDIVSDVIFKAAEIEAYILQGANPRADFQSSVDAAMAEVETADIAHVSDDKKRKVLALVRHWLKEYDAL